MIKAVNKINYIFSYIINFCLVFSLCMFIFSLAEDAIFIDAEVKRILFVLISCVLALRFILFNYKPIDYTNKVK